MKLQHSTVCTKSVKVLLMFMLLFSHVSALSLKYQESASEIIMNSLQTQPKKSFLRQLYRQLFFVPVWIISRLSWALAQLRSVADNWTPLTLIT